MDIELETLSLKRYISEKHQNLKDDFEKGESTSKYIYQIGERLEISKDSKTIFKSGYVIEDDEIPVGYLFISNMKDDEVFLEYSILKKFRGMGYGSSIVRETTNYLFENYNIRSVRLDIDPSNRNSTLVAISCGFVVDEEDFEERNYIGKMQFVRENAFYVSKRRK